MSGQSGTGTDASGATDTPDDAHRPGPATALTAGERAAAFSVGRPSVDRKAALEAGSTPIPRRAIVGIAVALGLIGLGGVVFDHFFGNTGLTTSVTTTLPTSGAPPTPATPAAPPLAAPLDAFIGLKQLGGGTAPQIQLRGTDRQVWSLAAQTGRVVVVTFYDQGCNDICPVLGTEIKQADALLGPRAANVEFAVVNTDPNSSAVSTAPGALVVPGLQSVPNVHFLTGPLRQLNATWIAYGVTVTIGNTPTQIAHNNVIYFVDPQGRLRSLALPFANENSQGAYVLAPADIQRFAEGIARTAATLIPST